MLKIIECNQPVHYYHQFANYYGDPTDDTTWEPGEDYVFNSDKRKYERKMIELPYEPIYVTTDEEWLINRILAYADENPLMCDIINRKNVEKEMFPMSKVMLFSIPKNMSWLLQE